MKMKYSIKSLKDTKFNTVDLYYDKIKTSSVAFHNNTSHIDKMNGYSIDYQTYYIIMCLLNSIQPNNILEFGYGYSTILFQLYKLYNIKCIHTVIENDKDWVSYFNENNNFIFSGNLIYKDIQYITINNSDVISYKNIRNKLICNYDFILIDGPRGSKQFSRPDILDIIDLFNDRCIIIIHDSDRYGEQVLIKQLISKMNTHFLYNYNYCSLISTYNIEKHILNIDN